MYSVEQIPVLNKIIYLRDSGFNVSEIAAALNEKDDKMIELLDAKYSEIEQTIQAERMKLSRIEVAKKEMLTTKGEMHYNILIKSVPGCLVLSLRRIIPDYYAEGELWKELSAFATENQVDISDNTFSIYHDIEYKETNVDVELCAPVKKHGKDSELCSYHYIEAVPIMHVQWYMVIFTI